MIPAGKYAPAWLRARLEAGAAMREIRYWMRRYAQRPAWFEACAVNAIYREARRRRRRGEDVVVDHVVPLSSPWVCGLHCAANLAIVPARVNRQKSNRRWPGMPLEQTELALEHDPQLELFR